MFSHLELSLSKASSYFAALKTFHINRTNCFIKTIKMAGYVEEEHTDNLFAPDDISDSADLSEFPGLNKVI